MSTITVLPVRDELRLAPNKLLIDGEWVEATSGQTWEQVHPASGEVVAETAVASEQDVDRAVRAARRAFDEGPWPRMSARERIRILHRVVDAIYEREDELNRLQTLDNGMPIAFSSIYQVGAAIMADLFDHYAGWVDKLRGETLPSYKDAQVMQYTRREPVGVVGSVIPWNAPLILLGLKLAPALACGNTVVLKPSEYAALCTLRLGEILRDLDLPPGVVNIVTGPGASTGEALITHPDVDKLAFTGSRAVGTRVMEAAAQDIKRVTLELGGKSANIIFPDAPDLDLAAASMIGAVTMGLSGQGCACLTRAIVHEDIYDDMIEKAEAFIAGVVQGDPFDPGTTSGPIINSKQLDRILGYIARGQEEGARLVCGGGRANGPLADGYWVEPTIFADVDNSSTIAQEEIFGPVLSVAPFREVDEAIALANASTYGLAGAVFTTDLRRALKVADGVRTGTFGINTYFTVPNHPFGGYKQSGLGREGGGETIHAYTEVKAVAAALGDDVAMG